jgi:hypothetical protein
VVLRRESSNLAALFQSLARGETFGVGWSAGALTLKRPWSTVGASTMRLLATALVGALLALPAGAANLEAPFEVHSKRHAILLELVVNGKDCTFILDTGAARTVVSPSVLGGLTEFELKLSRFRSRGPGFSGEATWGRVDSLRVGKQVWYDRQVVVMNLKEISRVYNRRIDGLLGQDLLSEFDSVVIDFKKKKIRFSR